MDPRSTSVEEEAVKIVRALFSKVASGDGEVKLAISEAASQFTTACAAAFASELQRESNLGYRAKIIEELLSTEEDYLQSLQVLETVWKPEVERTGVLRDCEVQILFSCIVSLRFLSSELIKIFRDAKETPVADQRLGGLFHQRIPFMLVFGEYACNQVQGEEFYERACQSGRFKDAMEKLRTGLPGLKNVSLQAYLSKPMARIVKYPLFLKDLISHTDASHPDYPALVKAEDAMKKVLVDINTKRSQRETAMVIGKLLPIVEWKHEQPDILGSRTRVLKWAKVQCTVAELGADTTSSDFEPEKGTHAYLFSNLFFVFRLKHDKLQEVASIPVPDMKFREDGENVVVCNATIAVTLSLESATERKLWLGALGDASLSPASDRRGSISEPPLPEPIQVVESSPTLAPATKAEEKKGGHKHKRSSSRTAGFFGLMMSRRSATPPAAGSASASAGSTAEAASTPSVSTELLPPLSPSSAETTSVVPRIVIPTATDERSETSESEQDKAGGEGIDQKAKEQREKRDARAKLKVHRSHHNTARALSPVPGTAMTESPVVTRQRSNSEEAEKPPC